jgi:plasmid maintenance system antidote protein VapI
MPYAEAFNTEADSWLRLQSQRDLWAASRRARVMVKPLAVNEAT